ncbi:VWA domain-containing protein [Myxococcota bacterium]
MAPARWLATFLIISLGGCSEKRYDYRLPIAGDYPEWVFKGSGSFMEGENPVLVGVGSVSGIKNLPLAKTTAANRARAEIAKVIEVYSASLMKDYMASTTTGEGGGSSEEQHVEEAIKTFSAATMSGVTIADYWSSPDGTVFARAFLDFSLVPELTKAPELDEKVRDHVRENAQKAFDTLDREEACHNVPGPNPEPAVDILFVIDDSGSMQEEQDNLARNFASFFSNLSGSSLDFHVGVVTTDVDYESKAGRLSGSVRVLRDDTADLQSHFKTNVAVGKDGSTTEKGLEALRLALTSPNLEGHNAGFLRETARLAVIIVSDENDQSPLPVSQYTQFLSQLKGGLKKITFASLVGEEGGCRSENGDADSGERYIEAARTFGEFGIVQSICQDDFAAALTEISGQISAATSRCRR